jgi:6-phosphogluconolactonase
VNSTTGSVTPVAGSPFTALNGTTETPPGCQTGNSGLASTQSVTFYPSGAFGYASNTSDLGGTNGGLWSFTIDPATGAPIGLGTSAGLCTGYPVTIDPSGQFAYSPGVMSDSSSAPYGLFGFTINATTGALTVIPGSPWTIGSSPPPPLATTIDPFGRFAYTPDGDLIWAFTINSTGALSPMPGSPFAFPSDSYAIAIAPNGQFAYVDAPNGVYAYSIDPSTGALSSVGSPVALQDANGTTLQLDPSGRFAYVNASAGAGQFGIYAYAIDATTGALTLVAGSPFAVGAYPLLVAISN